MDDAWNFEDGRSNCSWCGKVAPSESREPIEEPDLLPDWVACPDWLHVCCDQNGIF